MRILDRYIFKELLPPFAMGVAMFTAIFMGAALLPELAKLAIKGGGSLEVLWIFLLSIPSVIVVTFPMAMLLSTLLGMGRLSSDSELVAALASGISLRRMAVPVLALATVVAVFDFAFQETVVPSCYREVRDLKLGIRARADAAVEHNILFWVPDPAQGPARLIVGWSGSGCAPARAPERAIKEPFWESRSSIWIRRACPRGLPTPRRRLTKARAGARAACGG